MSGSLYLVRTTALPPPPENVCDRVDPPRLAPFNNHPQVATLHARRRLRCDAQFLGFATGTCCRVPNVGLIAVLR